MPSLTPASSDIAVVLKTFDAMMHGSVEDFAVLMAPDFHNYEQRDEPPETRGPRPEQLLGVARWLRDAYSELTWELHEVVAEDDLVAVFCTMAGRHTGDFAAYDLEGRVSDVFAPTGRRFASTQSHWQRMRDGRVLEHWANRDDLGSAEQLGWTAPTPASLVRNALAKRRARRAAHPPQPAEIRPFATWAGEPDGIKATALRAVELMRGAPLEAYERLYHPDAHDRERRVEPIAAHGRGPESYHAAARWLRDAFADPDWTVHHAVAQDDLVALHLTMSGRHVAPLAFHGDDGSIAAVFPPTGRRFAATQTHWMRFAPDGRILEHWSNRDDFGMAAQLGWIPPSPRYLARMALARRRAARR